MQLLLYNTWLMFTIEYRYSAKMFIGVEISQERALYTLSGDGQKELIKIGLLTFLLNVIFTICAISIIQHLAHVHH